MPILTRWQTGPEPVPDLALTWQHQWRALWCCLFFFMCMSSSQDFFILPPGNCQRELRDLVNVDIIGKLDA
eukprot:1805937-Lingulodinium_polyedra.AAC.1